ncbi:MAG: GNAT family N-acetyltransferase [Chloroflexota bacterium]|nr:MAG: GNAT family N-acetyltransferase [Chloroflexota bacterium]
MIVFLDGPVNAGKSTVGALLTSELQQAVHIEVDHLRHFSGALSLEEAIPFALADAAELTTTWVTRGFQVVLSWPIERDQHQRFAAATAGSGAPLHTFTLLPALEIALGDRGGRRLTSKERTRIREMYASMYAGDRPVGVVIDNSQQTPASTVRTILDYIEAGPIRAGGEPDADFRNGLFYDLADHPALADLAFIRQQTKDYNDSVSEHHRLGRRTGKYPLAAFIRRPSGEVVGGLLAATYWGWLDVDELWVAASWRHQGHGRRLMGLIEQAAIDRGCTHAQVKTFEFQARDFYERLGYQVVGRQKDYPPGQSFYWLRKEFKRNDP